MSNRTYYNKYKVGDIVSLNEGYFKLYNKEYSQSKFVIKSFEHLEGTEKPPVCAMQSLLKCYCTTTSPVCYRELHSYHRINTEWIEPFRDEAGKK